ncbi:hypothetical protein [uncultured Brevundimonas sp.]|uniref:hypothetical protein n=1 Tax=uncultured Brevundimonas sp. TaxID=213418 RepID=UPI00261D8B26|nr:hypothetical protein [uncultured Brevundimonas sp.]
MIEKAVRSAHRLLARELTEEEIDTAAGGAGGTTHTTREPNNPVGSDDADIGSTWRW